MQKWHFRYIVDDSRVLFLLQDGSQAYEVKDFLVQQDRCQEVTIDNRPFYGKGAKVREFEFLFSSFLVSVISECSSNQRSRSLNESPLAFFLQLVTRLVSWCFSFFSPAQRKS